MIGLAAQVLRFGAVGMLNTVIGLGTILLVMWLGASPILSNAIGFGAGLIVSFNVNRNWTFRREDTVGPSPGALSDMSRFFVAFMASWLLNIAVVWIGLQATDVSPYLLQIAGMVAYTGSFFVFCRVWVFRR